MQRSKTESYIGFARRAGKLTCGTEAVERQKKDVYLLLVCGEAAENTKKKAVKLQRRFGCPLLQSRGETLEEITGVANCRIAAVRDAELAKAVLAADEKLFTKFSGGNGQ